MASDSIFAWSTTASDNDDADSTINWSEGQNPSTVNNSARALMARVSEFLSDITSAKTTAGTGAAYTVTATQQPASLPDGFTLLILPHADNTGTCTINVNGLGAKALRSTSAENMAAGVLKANQAALVAYRQSSDEFLVLSGGGAEGTQFNWSKGADVASASSLTLGTDGNSFDITGTTAITSIGTLGVGTLVLLQFDDALTLTHHATDLVLPGEADIITQAGDTALFWEYATDDWRCINYQRSASLASGGGGPGKGEDRQQSIIRTNAKNITADITLSDHETTFTADAGADTLSVGTTDGFADEDTVYLTTTGTLPAGLSISTEYYVVSAAASTLQLAATNGGSAINITDTGSGTHTIYQAINGMSAGPITIESGHTVTIPEGSTWTVV